MRPVRFSRWVGLVVVVAALWQDASEATAAITIAEWRKQASSTRMLAENDAPGAYDEARRLEQSLPPDATPADHAQALNLLARVEVYLAMTDQADADARRAFSLAKT